ncbi:MAG: SCO2322 family protein [Actinomycetota bacterium]
MKPTRHARILRAAVIAILVTLAGGVVAAPAQAAAYRYWGYFHQTDGAWTFAQTGPAQATPADGAVEGWRFAVADESSVRTPRATPTFAALCTGTAITAGSKRVGLVIDFGRPADSADGATPPAPRATCVKVPLKATGADILVAGGATLRVSKALNCAIDGWPATGCGDTVANVSAAAASPDTKITIAAPKAPVVKSSGESSTSSTALILGGAGALALVGVLGFAAWRRGRDATDD